MKAKPLPIVATLERLMQGEHTATIQLKLDADHWLMLATVTRNIDPQRSA